MKQSVLPWTFDKNKAALIVVDMQNDFVREGAPMAVTMAREMIPNMQRIVHACRDQGIPVIYTQHCLQDAWDISPLETAYNPTLRTQGMRTGTPGVDIIQELQPQPGEYVIEKHRYDAFHNTPLDSILHTCRGMNQVDTVMIIGTVTNVCSESTARSAFMRDYKVMFLSDANGGFDDTSQQATLTIMAKVFARVIDTDTLVNEINQ